MTKIDPSDALRGLRGASEDVLAGLFDLGPSTVAELVGYLGRSNPSVNKSLGKLKERGLARKTDARRVYDSLGRRIPVWSAIEHAATRTMNRMCPLNGENGAVISDDGAYRYLLWRTIGDMPRRALFVMLNPSTADAMQDDPTVRRCIGFARREGCGRLDIVNLYAYRATDPRILRSVADPEGSHNDGYIADAARQASLVILGWGAFESPFAGRIRKVVSYLSLIQPDLWCLGHTLSGAPRHPLFVRRDAPLVRFGQ